MDECLQGKLDVTMSCSGELRLAALSAFFAFLYGRSSARLQPSAALLDLTYTLTGKQQ